MIRIIQTIMILLLVWACSFNRRSKGGLNKHEIPVLETGSIQPMPDQWIDKSTGYKVIRLSRREGGGKSFYFHNNPFIRGAGGSNDVMLFYGPVDTLLQLFYINLTTLQIEQLTDHPGWIRGEIVAPKSREAFYQCRDSVFAVNIDTKKTRLIFVFPDDYRGQISTINSDETLLAGVYAAPEKHEILRTNPEKKDYFRMIYDAKIPHTIFTIDIMSGEFYKLHIEDTWLNHVQFSPADPALLMYAHEGPWHFVDRIWNIDVETGMNKLMHHRSIEMEIAGHEFFSRDGKSIWYDLQVPRGETFYLANVEIATGQRKRYRMFRDEWSVHFTISPDQKLFAGDGGDSTQVAHAKNGKWIYLFRPSGDSLLSEKLVDMKHHDYRSVEPNVHFTPDGRLVVFRSDLDGETNIYAVEIKENNVESNYLMNERITNPNYTIAMNRLYHMIL